MKQLLITILTLFFLNVVNAQSHNPGPNSNCKLNKDVWLNSEKMACPACDNIVKKEKIAKAAEDKRRTDALLTIEKAEKAAAEKARLEKIAEDKKSAEASKVYINAQPNHINNRAEDENPEIMKAKKYTVESPFMSYDETFFSRKRNVKILYEGKTVFESNDYNSIFKVHDKVLFYLKSASSDSKCKADNSNSSILVNEKGEQVSIPGIDKFGYITNSKVYKEYHEVVVFDGTCTPVYYGVNLKGGDWHTTRYTFDLKTMTLINTEKSWQHTCNCE